jgi:hypothetical protein
LITPCVPGDLVVFKDTNDIRAGEVMRVDRAGAVITMQPFGMKVSLSVPIGADVRVEPQSAIDMRAARLAKVNAFDSFEKAKKHLAAFKKKATA